MIRAGAMLACVAPALYLAEPVGYIETQYGLLKVWSRVFDEWRSEHSDSPPHS